MRRHLVNHAVENVWCAPRQDNLHVLELHRLTARLGSLVDVKVNERVLPLPNTRHRFHVYQIGQISAEYLGALSIAPNWLSERWTSFNTAINIKNTQIDLYNEKGIMIPRFNSYYMMTKHRNLIVAVEINNKIPVNLDTDDLFIRFYKNYLFTAVAGSATVEKLYCNGAKLSNTSAQLDFIAKYNQYKNKEGYVTCFVNGYVVDKIDSYSARVGDIAEFVYDSTIYKVVEVTVEDLPVFHSQVDNCLKYIVHHSKLGEEYINFQDDIDIDVVYKKNNRYKGGYYHRNLEMSHRMVTHRDYSLPVSHVVRSLDYIKVLDNEAPKGLSDYRLIVKVKQTKIERPLVFENNRIFELYKLPDDKIIDSLTGTNSTVEVWHATNLEKSMYTTIMRMIPEDITIDNVKDAYGYNAVTKVVAESPLKTFKLSNTKQAILPIAYRLSSTVYEYDSDGFLIGAKVINNQERYISHNLDVALIEPIVGLAYPSNNDIIAEDEIDIPKHGYRVYRSYHINGDIDNSAWEDITNTSLYIEEDGLIKYTGASTDNQMLRVRSEDHFFDRDFEVPFNLGGFEFTIKEEIQGAEVDMVIPRGEIDLFLNGKSLIYGLDYMVEFPKVYIYNTAYLNRPLTTSIQIVKVRMTGFSNPDMSLNEADDYGFIRHGALSDNHRFNIRDDKVLRITINGAMQHREDLKFDESSPDRDVINSLNGKPYQIKDYVIPVRELVDEDTYSYRNRSLAIDKQVSDYLTLNIPPVDKGPISAIEHRYRIVSSFISRVIELLITNVITDARVDSMTKDIDIVNLLKEHEYLLREDPIQNTERYPEKEVVIVPYFYNSRVTLSVSKIRFITRVIQLYSHRAIDINQYLLVA